MSRLVLLASLLAACGVTVYAEPPDPLSGSGVHRLGLTLAEPDPSVHPGPHPGLVFVHGGYWAAGFRSEFAPEIAQAAERGYVAITIDYRLTAASAEDGGARFPWPAQIEDVRCAIRWLRAHAAELDLDTTQVGVTGFSAGGHLALMAGLVQDETGFDGSFCTHDAPASVQAVVSRAGPTDLAGQYAVADVFGVTSLERLLDLEDGTTPEDDPGAFAAASPLTWADAAEVPVLQLQGQRDTTVDPEGARSLDAALDAAGTVRTLIEYEDSPHSFVPGDDVQATEQMFRWFDRHLRGEEVDLSCSPWPSCV